MTLGDILRPSTETALTKFTRDLTSAARAGRLDPIRCRDPEIDRVIDVLLRHGKNNPVLTGPAGVGKTAIVEGLAQRAAEGRLPLALRGARVLALDHMALLGGTMYRGQYEERVQAIVAEVTAAPDVILFIDELHNLVGQGTAQGAAMDAGNMLKPALTRGDFRVIGATTSDEYERWIMTDPALERRFQRVDIRELSPPETMEILRARRAVLERHHGVVITDDALQAALQLTDEWMVERMRPDRCIDALDETCAHLQAKAAHSPRTEALLKERRALIAERAAAEDERAERARQRRAEARRAGKPAEEAGVDAPDDASEETGSDKLNRYAQQGMAYIERFGQELESFFGDAPPPQPIPKTPPRAAPRPAPRPAPNADGPLPPPAPRLGEIEAELAPLLVAEGAVVRGVDVARIVSRTVGRTVKWP
ncbi:AAA ATPase central domain protein [Gemmatirosa kalamazoonensis]|uniref:AAA ATPase central domain protein n=1 Tax=Gemmatirosa kalamazoonensis TaxID=861299 RepID=W0RPF8_9BACT|nr:AAA ATPase central domain protein [Gemmatirosa kalamazoonensis]